MPYEREKQIAVDAVTLASRLCSAVRTEIVQVESLAKDDRSPVTIADFGSQALICRDLKSAFPEAAIVAEEDSTELLRHAATLDQVVRYVRRFRPDATPDSVCRWIDWGNGTVGDRFWTLDPIDGTKGFLRNDQYAIALALIERGQVQVGALACPALPLDLDAVSSAAGVLFVAVRGAGAWMTPLGSEAFTPIRVAPLTAADRLRFVESVEAGHSDLDLQEAVAQAVGITRPPLRMDSQVKYGVVARGDAALYLRLPSPRNPNYREKIWDHAAGALIVEEAGGRATDMHGRPLDFASGVKMNTHQGVIASQGELHDAAVTAIRSRRKSSA
jgi:3'(2'), 5'-bisphosphate nucleotidase